MVPWLTRGLPQAQIVGYFLVSELTSETKFWESFGNHAGPSTGESFRRVLPPRVPRHLKF